MPTVFTWCESFPRAGTCPIPDFGLTLCSPFRSMSLSRGLRIHGGDVGLRVDRERKERGKKVFVLIKQYGLPDRGKYIFRPPRLWTWSEGTSLPPSPTLFFRSLFLSYSVPTSFSFFFPPSPLPSSFILSSLSLPSFLTSLPWLLSLSFPPSFSLSLFPSALPLFLLFVENFLDYFLCFNGPEKIL